MQHAGTLKKRQRRYLSRVNGLGARTYDEDATHVFFSQDNRLDKASSSLSTRKEWIVLRMSSAEITTYRKQASTSNQLRVTRDPGFHSEFDVENHNETEQVTAPFSAASSRPVENGAIDTRTNLLDDSLMLRLKQLVWVGKCVGLFPWTWNEKTCTIEKWSPRLEKLWWLQWYLVSAHAVGICCFQLHTFLNGLMSSQMSNRERFMSSYTLLRYVCKVILIVNFLKFGEKTRCYINTMFNFNKIHVQKYVIHLDDYHDRSYLVTNPFLFYACMTQILLGVGSFIKKPCTPIYLFSYICPKPGYWLIPGALHEIMMVGQYISYSVLIPWIIIAHSSTTQFWLREIHNDNDSDYTTDNLRISQTAIEMFKGLQVLNGCFNDCMAPISVPYIKFCTSTPAIVSGYIFIRSMNHLFIEEFPGILKFPFSMWNCFILVFTVLAMSAEVYDLSCSFIDSWKNTKQKNIRRTLMSFPTLKIWSGRFYYISLLTLVTLFKMIFDVITDCIIAIR